MMKPRYSQGSYETKDYETIPIIAEVLNEDGPTSQRDDRSQL